MSSIATKYNHHKTRSREKIPAKAAQALFECIHAGGPFPIFMFGMQGSGKTCAALAALDYIGPGRKYYTEDDLCDEVNDATKGELCDGDGYKINKRQFWDQWQKYRLAVIDELGMRQTPSDARYATVKKAMDSREGKPLILVSNKTPQEIGQIYDARILSRLKEGKLIKFPDIDLRGRGK